MEDKGEKEGRYEGEERSVVAAAVSRSEDEDDSE